MGKNDGKSRNDWSFHFNMIRRSLAATTLGQNQACESIASIGASHRLRIDTKPEKPAARCLIIGPTSSGKTHIADQLTLALDLPFTWVNASLLTPPGFKGYDINTALRQLINAYGKGSPGSKPSVLILDEADKIMRRSRQDGNWADQIQYSLLPLLGGEQVQVSGEDSSLEDTVFQTHNTLVLLMGVFPEIPFSTWNSHEESFRALVKYGFCEEFVSRLTHIVPLEGLNRTALRDLIIREVANERQLYKSGLYSPDLTPKEVLSLTKFIETSPFGIRGSRLLIHRMLQKKAASYAKGL